MVKNIYLASKSPRRVKLLKKLGIDFIQISLTSLEELEQRNFFSPGELALFNAAVKAYRAIKLVPSYEESLIITADTIVSIDGKILGKPKERSQAETMLRELSGRFHYVYTGVVVLKLPQIMEFRILECTKVKFRSLLDKEISAYTYLSEPYDKAGAYAIQGKGGIFIESLEGCFYNVVGLPIAKLAQLLNSFGIDLWAK